MEMEMEMEVEMEIEYTSTKVVDGFIDKSLAFVNDRSISTNDDNNRGIQVYVLYLQLL